jgi:WD40 repeat protein
MKRLRQFFFNAVVVLYTLLTVSPLARGDPPTTAPRASPLPAPREIARLEGHTGGMLLFSPNGAVILTANGSRRTTNSSTEVQLWDARTFKEMGRPLMHQGLSRATFDAAGKKLLTVACFESGAPQWKIISGEAKLWDVRTGKLLLPPFDHGGQPLTDAAISPDGTTVATCSHTDRIVRLWDTTTGKQRAALAHDRDVLSVQFSPAGLLVTHTQAVVTLWDTPLGKLHAKLPELFDGLSWYPPVFSADGKRLAAYGYYHFEVYDLPSGRKVAEIHPELHLDEPITGIALNADGTLAATTSQATTPDKGHVWDVATGKSLIGAERAYSGNPVFSPDGHYVIFNIYHGAAMWDLRARRPVALPDHFNCSLVAFSPDGKRLAIDSSDGYTAILAIDDAATTKRGEQP